jgi:hypothetical protein
MAKDIIAKNYMRLAQSVITRAELDAQAHVTKQYHTSYKEYDDAKAFLNNSPELEFFADVADCRADMVKAGYIREVS